MKPGGKLSGGVTSKVTLTTGVDDIINTTNVTYGYTWVDKPMDALL